MAVHIRRMESIRAHDSEVAPFRAWQRSGNAYRAFRSCDGRRSHWSMSLPNGASKNPKEAAVHAAIAHARDGERRA
eukprot:1493239-Pleurochrysis_carterae.AAC.1